MRDFKLYFVEKSPHLSLIVTGFLMLREQGKLSLTWQMDRENSHGLLSGTFLEAVSGGKRIIFDMSDGYPETDEFSRMVSSADFYFKRSFSERLNSALPQELKNKLYPLGLHYHVSYPGNFMDTVSGFGGLLDNLYQTLFNGAPRRYFTPDKFRMEPVYSENPTVIFYTRLWNPSDQRSIPEYYDSIVRINEGRVGLVRGLKGQFGKRFVGGIQYSPFAKGMCGDLIAGISDTRRKNYLNTMHCADICIGTTGLHDSIGWKTAEYVAASKAIVSERLRYEVDGDFKEGRNYLPFDSIDECISNIDYLMARPREVYEMKCANAEYYDSFLRPDRLVGNALGTVFPDFDTRSSEWALR